jgi:aryl-alcohol dehydrogenase-like predicted oxidoreductase
VPADSRAASPHFERFVAPYLDARCAGIVEAVLTAADGLGVSPLEVALAWVRDRPGVVAPVLGARTVGQLLGALQSEKVELPPEIRSALDDVSAVTWGYPERQT